MPDICMCDNEDCLIKEACFRYVAIPSPTQAYATFGAEIDFEGNLVCDWYWPINTNDADDGKEVL